MLDSWGCEDPDEVVALLTSEIVSNAVRHAVGTVGLEIAIAEEGELRVQARDHSPHAVVIGRRNPGGVGGHGLHIVATLARRWGVDRCGDTKVVWFETCVSSRVLQATAGTTNKEASRRNRRGWSTMTKAPLEHAVDR